MKPPSTMDIHTFRWRVFIAIRLVALVMCVSGMHLFLKRIFFWLGGAGSFRDILTNHMEIGENMAIYRGLSLIILSLSLWFLARSLARRIITMPPQGCPKCGYEGASGDTCTECGSPLIKSESHEKNDTDSKTPHTNA